MSCYNPNLMRCSVDRDTGRLCYVFKGSARYSNPKEFGSFLDLESVDKFDFIVPCGKCVGCRIDYVREWSNRMAFELIDNDYKAIFVTLTYDNDHLTFTKDGPTLNKKDTSDFFKRLRYYFPGKKIRYYISGEYGPKTFRPHYHAIIYGLELKDFQDLVVFGSNELRQAYYTSKKLADIWQNGFIMLSEVNYKTCAYVARYVLKKRKGEEKRDLGLREPEFNLSSRRPGIGYINAEKYVMSGMNFFDFPFSDGQHRLSLPRSFIRHIKRNISEFPQIDIDKLNQICYTRSKDSNWRLQSNLIFLDLPYPKYLDECASQLSRKLRLLPERK